MDDDIQEHLKSGRYREAFESLLDRYQEKVFRLACGILRNETVAEDATQDIFLKIWRALPRFQAQAALSTWIYAIARNTCLTEIKRRRPMLSLSEPEFGAALEQLPELQVGEGGSGAALDIQGLLDQLPEKYRRVIVLYYLDQKSYEEVAQQLNLPMGTVKTFLHRARKELLSIGARADAVLTAA